MNFSIVAEALELLDVTTSRLKITAGLAELFKKTSADEARLLSYLLLGDLHAKYRSTLFNLAEKNLTTALSAYFGCRDEDCGEQQLSVLGDKPIRLKVSSAAAKEFVGLVKKLGDVGQAVEQVHHGKICNRSLKQVYGTLEKISEVSGEGSFERKVDLLVELLEAIDPVSAKYVVRIIQGKLRLGFSEMTLLDALSWMKVGDKSLRPDLEAAYNVFADIGLIAETLKNVGIGAIRKIHVKPGIPIRPAAAERLADAAEILKKLGPCVAQPKLDGIRLQMHKFKEGRSVVVKFFSRNLQDVTHMFPELAEAARSISTKPFIAEGEAIAFDQKTGKFLPFQETAKRRRKKEIEKTSQSHPMRLYVFDLLFCGKQELLESSHKERRRELLKLFGSKAHDKRGVVQVIEELEFDDPKGLAEYFNQCMKNGLEGIIAKRVDAKYQAGKRNFNWVKLKRIETGTLEDTIDCVVLGYYRGRGRRAKFGIGALLVGVFNSKKERFQSVAKIGTGLSDKELQEYKRDCDKIDAGGMPSNVDVAAAALAPDVWVVPKIVCIVRADEISRSPLHSAGAKKGVQGLALRFPRVMGRRQDKSPSEATTLAELESLRRIQEKKRS